jgi:endonuclease G
MRPTKKLLLVLYAAAIFTSCKKDVVAPTVNEQTPRKATTELTTTLSETFESGTKAAYTTANVTLSSGSWSLNDALIGNLSTDLKTGTQSVRIRNTGIVNMNFDATGGATTITISHGIFGSDGSSTWQLWISTNSGSSYTQVGSTITSTTSFQTATFTASATGNYRLSIRKISGGTNRINIDNITVTTGTGTGGGGGGTTGDNSNLLMGNPSNATTSTVLVTNYLMDKTYYTSSYNSTRGTPNWVSWHLNSSDIGSVDRLDDYRADVTLPGSWYQVGSTSYSGSGFDRGHNCPSGDRTATSAANSATFLMDNMIPQAPQNNQQTWNNMEQYIRTLVTAGNEVYIVMGSYGTGGTGSSGSASTIDGGHVTVPSNVWKVVVVISNGNGDLARVTSSTRVIAVNTPNINTTNSDWKTYRTSVNAIETATGYDILSALPTSVQSVVEATVDNL